MVGMRGGAKVNEIIVVGLGGVGTALVEPLARYMEHNKWSCSKLHLVDGDVYESHNLERQRATEAELTKNKAEVHAAKLKALLKGITVIATPKYVNEQNVSEIVGDSSTVFSCVDNHKTRKILQDRCSRLKEVILISGGNEYHDGNVQVYLKRNGRELSPPITKYHEEIAYPTDLSPEEMSCEELQESEPQLLFTNLMVACLMLNAFYGCIREVTPRYHEVYFDILENCARPAKR
jgi:molybdopterin/thiamine biosynthesis adenylyltransferase